MPDYCKDRAWSDRFIPAIKRIVGPHLLDQSPLDLDTKEATDLIVLRARDMRIAARVRRKGYAERYPYDFTIRSLRDSGAETEFSKIISGWGDWFFYGHEKVDDDIGLWWLIDLNSFRRAVNFHLSKHHTLQYSLQSNMDGTHFVAYDIRSFPTTPRLIIARSAELKDEAA